jgi:hypothetical protein
MTAAFTLLLPMLGACFAAMLVPTLLRDTPIYEALREGTLRREQVAQRGVSARPRVASCAWRPLRPRRSGPSAAVPV